MEKFVAPSLPSSPDRLVRVKELRQLLGNPSISTIYRWVDQGVLPPPRRLSARFVAWRLSDVARFLRGQNKEAGND